MSHQFYKPAKSRLQRSELAVPGSSPKMFEKALNSSADYVFLDLEDAVSPHDKITARKNTIQALGDLPWRDKGKTISFNCAVRVSIAIHPSFPLLALLLADENCFAKEPKFAPSFIDEYIFSAKFLV